MSAAIKVAKSLPADQRVIVLLADSIRNYMSKHLNDQWMINNKLMTSPQHEQPSSSLWWSNYTVGQLNLQTPLTVTPHVSCSECIDLMGNQGFDQLPCVSETGEILGMVTVGNLTSQITSGRVQPTDPITKALYKQLTTIPVTTPLSALSRLFDVDHFVLVVTSQKCYNAKGVVNEKSLIFGIVTRIDLLNFILTKSPNSTRSANGFK